MFGLIFRRFNVTADLNLSVNLWGNFSDALHTDDICYLFQLGILFYFLFSCKNCEQSLKFRRSSCHVLDDKNAYDKHLESKSWNYDLIMRSVKMITNFARTG